MHGTVDESRASIEVADERATEAELVRSMAAGDLDALATLYDRYRTIAYALALRITSDAVLAEDVVHDAFLGAWRSAERYLAERSSVKTWLLSIVHHRAIDAVRRRRPTDTLPDLDEPAPAPLVAADVWGEVGGRIDADVVRTALAALPLAQREALELAYYAGLTQQEVAARTGAPLGTVKSRMRLGLLALRRAIGDAVSVVDDAGGPA
jgi:RNA polymerase sigma-70 factor (ECF subfamily)